MTNNLNMDTELQNINRGLHVKVKEEKFYDDKSCLEKVYFPQHIANGNLEDDKLVEVINIKQEVQDHQEQVSVLEDTHYAKHAKYHYDLKFDTSETSDLTVKIESSDLESIDSYFKNTTVDLENNCVGIDLKPENGANIYENSDLKLENSGLFNYRLDANYTGNDVKVQATSSIIANVYLKSEFNMSSDLNLDKPDLQSDKADLNIEKSASGNEARDFMNENIDGLDDTEEPKPILLIKRRPNTILNIKRSQVYHIIHKPICPNKRDHSEVPHKCIRLNTSNVQKQQDITCKPEILHQGNTLIGTNELGTIDHLQKDDMISEHTVRPYQCNKCEEVFNTMLKLRNHMISHGSEQPYNCNMCQNGFKTMFELGNHMAIHGIGKPLYLQCSSCEKKFKTKSGLRWHMVSHSSERPYKCKICQKGFKRMNNCTKHLTSHSATETEMPHMCDKCAKRFPGLHELKQHMISHSTERPHQCNICEKKFKRNSTLTRHRISQHMVSHSTERPHQCNICEKKFKRLSTLTRHRITHSSELSCE